MRTLTLVLTIAILVLGVHALAQGDEASGDEKIATLEKQVKKLQAQVEYLRMRDIDVTKYLIANQDRGAAIEAMVDEMLRQGYTHKAIPPASRETLMDGLKALGESLQTDVPTLSAEEVALLKAIDRIK